MALTYVVFGSVNVSRQDVLLSILMEAVMGNIPETLCEAITLKKCVELDYDGHRLTVEVHVVGSNSKTRNTLLRCFQVSGGSNSNEHTAWKLMVISKVSNCSITNLTSMAPRPQYNPKDKVMTGGTICHV